MARLPLAIPLELAAVASDLPADVLTPRFAAACERLDRFVGALAVETAAALELGPALPPIDLLMAARGWRQEDRLALRWLVETLVLYGCAEPNGEGWRLLPAAPGPAAGELRAAGERVEPAAAPAYELLDRCAASLPAILRGELRGQDAVFGPATLGLWFDYFCNDNPHYGPSNTVAAAALARAVPRGGRVLEVGGGGGSAAEAAFRALGDAGRPPATYAFSELHPAFLRRGARAAQRAATPGCELRTLRFDIDLPPAAQGLTGERFDAVYGVNTLHLARDLVATLANLRSLLAPGGALVLGELLRPSPAAPVHIELPFTLLAAYSSAPLLAGVRERPGFLSASGWRRALELAGYTDVTLLPAEIERCAAVYPGFYCGALTARA